MAEHNSSEEVDLGVLFNRMKGVYHSILIWIYGIVRFLLKNIIPIIILIVLGLVAGYFLNKSKNHDQETSLIVQINFNGGNYIYDAVEQLSNKIAEKDTEFLEGIGFAIDEEIVLKSIEISPIVSITEILKKLTVNDRNVDLFLQQAQYENQILTSEIFIPEYKTHKIELIASHIADEELLEKLTLYLNDNKLLQESKGITIKNTEFQIKENQETIAYIDSIARLKGSKDLAEAAGSQISVNMIERSNDPLHLLIEEKRIVMQEILDMQIELLKYDNPVVVLNNPVLQLKKSFTSRSMLFYPILLLGIFFIFSIFISVYRKAKELSEREV